MKKLLLISLLSFSIFTLAQEYHFDYAFKYDKEINGEKRSRELVVNSANHDYEMSFYLRGKKKYAELTDYKNNVRHLYAVESDKFPLKKENFKYHYSKRFQSLVKQIVDEDRRRFFTTQEVESPNELHHYTISEFYDSKKKNKRAAISVKMLEINADLSGFGLSYFLDYINAGNKVKFPKSYILEQGDVNYDGLHLSIKLDYIESQNFDLFIDQPVYR